MSPLSDEEKRKIIEEERVRAEARAMFSDATTSPKTKSLSKQQKRLLVISILIIIAVPVVAIYWYVAVPAVLLSALWRWKKIPLSHKQRLYAAGVVTATFALINGSLAFAHRAPSIEILEPRDTQSLQAATVVLKGKVNPHYAKVAVAGTTVTVATNGTFEQVINLTEESNPITITAENSSKKKDISLTVTRIFTEEEKAERERIAKEQAEQQARQKIADEKLAKERAEQRAKQAEIDAKNQAEANEKKDGDVAGACAQMRVEQGLKAPSTAKFGSWKTTPLGKNKYTVVSYVDAQNGFGAMIRTGYTCTVTVVDADNFICSTSCKF